MFGTCSTNDCDQPRFMLDNHCRYHSIIEQARSLRGEEFDRLRDALATTAPITDDERNVSRASHALRMIQWQARDLKKAKADARKAGATEGQIADAMKRGKAEVS